MMTREWIQHDGTGLPIDGEAIVDLRFRDGSEYYQESADYWQPGDGDARDYWVFDEKPSSAIYDIVAYRIVSAGAA